MKTIVRVFAHLLFALGLFVFIAMPGNEYSWMKDMDPSITALPADDGAGSRTIFTLLLLIAMVAAQLGLVFIAKSGREKAISMVLVAVACSLWLSRYW
jgi:hypothetical protein